MGFIMIYIVTGTNSITSIIEQSDKIAQVIYLYQLYPATTWRSC